MLHGPDQETTYTVLVGFHGHVGGILASYSGNAVRNVTAKSTTGDIMGKGLGYNPFFTGSEDDCGMQPQYKARFSDLPAQLREGGGSFGHGFYAYVYEYRSGWLLNLVQHCHCE